MGECILAGHPHSGVKCGTYTGNGVNGRVIDLGITPKWVLVIENHGRIFATNYPYGGLATAGSPVKQTVNYAGNYAVEIVDGGFKVRYELYGGSSQITLATNQEGLTYNYIYGT